MKINHFIHASEHYQKDKLMYCCPCSMWAEDVIEQLKKRVNHDISELVEINEILIESWGKVDEKNKLIVFSSHARIGDINALKSKHSDQTKKEQGQIESSDMVTIEDLFKKNKVYFNTFGFIFITCATGKSAKLMLSEINNRLHNSREKEIFNASKEQEKITLLRFKDIISN